MNDTTFQGNGKIAYVPVVVNTKLSKLSNADRIRAMTDEELAEYMDGSFRNADWCDQSKFPGGDCMEAPCIGCITDWLKQEVEHESKT